MTPRPPVRSRSWDGSWYATQPRRAVEGGVVVAKPGKVTGAAAAELVAAAEMETSSAILARGRTYARAGQVVELEAAPGTFSAQIQGTDAAPYRVRLMRTVISGSDRIAAHCSCPYGCDHGWCKHAAALAYVAAFLLDSQPGTVAAWAGEEVDGGAGAGDRGAAGGADGGSVAGGAPPLVVALSEEDLATLRGVAPLLDPAVLLSAAEVLVPHPWGGSSGSGSGGARRREEGVGDLLDRDEGVLGEHGDGRS